MRRAAPIACIFAVFLGTCAIAWSQEQPKPPEVIVPKGRMYTVGRAEGGFTLLTRDGDRYTAIATIDEARAWKGRAPSFNVPEGDLPASQLLLDRNGELHAFALKARGTGRKPAVDFFIDLYHGKTEGHGAQWGEMEPFYEGYVGDILDAKQLDTGRIVVPFAYWVSGLDDGPPVGSNRSTTVVSDDGGITWSQPGAALVSPCFANHNGSNNGAVEPVILPLKDGTLWMLMRTQAGFLYESFSRDGAVWSPATASRFHSSSGPPGLLRLPDGRIAVFWNNCEMPPRLDGQGVYGGRDALHGAISDDEGRTWRGFREIYRDARRNESPPHSGDRGTAYPLPSYSEDGYIMVIAGQGGGGRNVVFIDPAWLTAARAQDDFSHELDDWCVFKEFGPASGWWRDRCQGPVLVDHPDKPGAKVLHIRRPDERDPDVAIWNFPNGRTGSVTIRLRLQDGFAGANIALHNRFFNPGDPDGIRTAMFNLAIPADGNLGAGPRMEMGRMCELVLAWDLTRHRCDVQLDGQWVLSLPLLNQTDNGISYLRLASTANQPDTAGYLIESVAADITESKTMPIDLLESPGAQ